MPVRVLLVGKGWPDRGGIATFLSMLLQSALAERHQLELLNLAHTGERQGGRATWGNAGRTLHDGLATWRRARQVDVVHLHTAMAPLVTLLRAGVLATAARAGGARVVVHAHGGLVQLWLTSRRRRLVARAALTAVDHVVAVSAEGRSAVAAALGDDRVSYVMNGVDTRAFAPDGQPVGDRVPPRVVYVGLLSPRKGVLDLLEAARLLRSRGVPHELWLVGGTPDEGADGELQVASRAAGLAELLGVREHAAMPQMYREADVFCLPSWWEAMPLSVLEAMACGLPVVATSVGDVPTEVEAEVTGVLVPVKSPEALADALGRLLRDPVLRHRMGRASRARVERHFSLDRTVDELDRIFQRLPRRAS